MVSTIPVTEHQVVSREEWLAARNAHLENEKRLTRMRDQISAERRSLPWVKIEKDYTFEGPDGPVTLADLFNGNSQLIVCHFMFGPEWEAGCIGCSFRSDHLDGTLPHLTNHDVTLVSISRAPMEKIAGYKSRMGWQFPWVSSFNSDFNSDFFASYTSADREAGRTFMYNFQESEAPDHDAEISGISVFHKTANGDIYHTYSAYARGEEMLMNTYNLLDLTPNGRNETGGLIDWVRPHDLYGAAGHVNDAGEWVPAESTDCACH
jgi:predicted dithiol-disulfide oxidoreductase (DUF899 family)